jgi:mannose-1-phosphate guanylyltransferase
VGDYLPKQYMNFVDSRSMLEHAWDRAETLIPAERLFTVVAKHHLRFREVQRQLALKPPHSLVVQPVNKETAPGILLPLLHIHKRYPDATVALFPSDHFVLEEDRFMGYVDDAFRVVESDASRLVLLGLEPDGPDTEYGYIVPGRKIDPSRSDSAMQVEMFVEKPSIEAAKKIIARGALWNTMVMIFACKTLLSVMQHAAPEVYRSFEPIQDAIGTADEQQVVERVYQKLPSLNFSKGVIEALPVEHRSGLLVLPARAITWSDWGTSDRLLQMLGRLGAPEYASRQPVGAQARRLRVA